MSIGDPLFYTPLLSGDSKLRRLSLATPLLVNAFILLFLPLAYVLNMSYWELYYASVQEDGLLEWMTFWAFVFAGIVFGLVGFRQFQEIGFKSWFLWGLAAFCFLFAMEEISWGQRLFGYQPPEYFLKENYQQEFNFHNVLGTSIRSLILKVIILGYGVVLPMFALLPSYNRILDLCGIKPPSNLLIPSFLAIFLTYQIYPWSYSGEWVEMMLGLAFAFTAILHWGKSEFNQHKLSLVTIIAFLSILSPGIASSAFTQWNNRNDPIVIKNVKLELNTLAQDFKGKTGPITKCGIHQRVYTYSGSKDGGQLKNGEFAFLLQGGASQARAEYFIDPWNSPYWIRHICDPTTGKEWAIVYSLGPNRRRDSSRWKVLGDDIGSRLIQIEGQ